MKTHQCQAIATARTSERPEPAQCHDEATETIDGVQLCWCHARALRNPKRSTRLQVVEI